MTNGLFVSQKSYVSAYLTADLCDYLIPLSLKSASKALFYGMFIHYQQTPGKASFRRP